MSAQHAAHDASSMEPRAHLEPNPPNGRRPRPAPQISSALFALLLLASLAIPAFWEVAPIPGSSLVFAGLMLLTGLAELLDPSLRRFATALRWGGGAMAVLGLVAQLLA